MAAHAGERSGSNGRAVGDVAHRRGCDRLLARKKVTPKALDKKLGEYFSDHPRVYIAVLTVIALLNVAVVVLLMTELK